MEDEEKEAIDVPEGATPLDPDDIEGLIPELLTTRSDLNRWEALNIAQGQQWALSRKEFDALSVDALRELHRRMFDETWEWAGKFRRSENSISPYSWTQVPVLLAELLENTHAQHDVSDQTADMLDEIAIRYHHQLVRLHPWPNGNGRHARLATDLLLSAWTRPPFTWGAGNLDVKGGVRSKYLEALRSADAGNYEVLKRFVRT